MLNMYRMITKNIFSTFLICCLLVFNLSDCYSQQKIELPPLAGIGKGGLLEVELIYPLENKPTAECHASTIAELNDGFIAAWFGGTEESYNDVGIWISFYLGKKWSKPVEVVNGY